MVKDANDIPRVMKEAFHLATTGRPGPVLVDLPKYVIPVKPGRNEAVLLEVTALHQRLKNTGYNPARRLDEELIKHMLKKRT